MQYYTYKIEGNEPIQLNVGNHRLHIEWRWNTVAQEQKDNLDRMLLQAVQSDPLINNTGIIVREYNYLKYYTEVVPQDAIEQEAWLSSADILPQSILRVGPSTAAALSLLRERVSLCTGLKEYDEELLEELHYQALITDENENRTVVDVIPGGWFRDQDQYYALNFQSAMERIERDQLPLVTIYFEVYDGE